MEWTVGSAAEMEALGHQMAQGVTAGHVVALTGGLGAGKTHWTKGFAAGLGYGGDVTSPTFSLVHEYRGGWLPLFHFDFYRLGSAADLASTGWDEYIDEPAVIVAEWADLFPEYLPPSATWLAFEVLPDGSRKVVMKS